jgi:site-specific DNA recombinase
LLVKLRHGHEEAEAGLARLLGLVEKGLMHIEDGALRERLIGLKLQRDETAKDIGDVQKRLSSAEPIITPEKINRIALLLRDKLHNGPSEPRQAFARLLMDEVNHG